MTDYFSVGWFEKERESHCALIYKLSLTACCEHVFKADKDVSGSRSLRVAHSNYPSQN